MGTEDAGEGQHDPQLKAVDGVLCDTAKLDFLVLQRQSLSRAVCSRSMTGNRDAAMLIGYALRDATEMEQDRAIVRLAFDVGLESRWAGGGWRKAR